MSLFMIETEDLDSSSQTIDSLSSSIDNVYTSVSSYDTSCEDGFNFVGAKNAISEKIKSCSTKVKNVATVLNTVSSSHTSLQNSMKFGGGSVNGGDSSHTSSSSSYVSGGSSGGGYSGSSGGGYSGSSGGGYLGSSGGGYSGVSGSSYSGGESSLSGVGGTSTLDNSIASSVASVLGATSGVLPNARIGESGRPAYSGYYLRQADGGINPYKLNGGGGGVGGNCTYYAYSRFSELLGENATGLRISGNANHWLERCKGYKTGQEPRLGAIAVWQYPNRDSGHVAIVEEIKENGDIVTSQGGWSNKAWYYNKTYSKANNYAMDVAGTKKLLGFIYPEKI